MGKSGMRKTRNVAAKIRTLKASDPRLQKHSTTDHKQKQQKRDADAGKLSKNVVESKNVQRVDGQAITHSAQTSAAMFLAYNSQLGPPYRVLVDTNFINFSIMNKLEMFTSFMDCLLAKCIPIITDCVMAELEKLGIQYRIALRIAKDPRFVRLPCTHKGVYADDCMIDRVTNHKCYIVATCDRELKRRIRKIPGVPIMYIADKKYCIERFADVSSTPK